MIISFFEEFPTAKNLDKLRFVRWPTKIYLAARSLKEFKRIKSRVKNVYIKEFVYWPVLGVNEGYWISPFSKRGALKRIFSEIKNKNVPVMIDAELPTTSNPSLYVTQLFNFLSNKRLIQNFCPQPF